MKTGQVPFSPDGQNVLGVGTDLVNVPQFALLLETPGSVFGEPGGVFTSRELRRAQGRSQEKGDSLAHHLAAVWAIKEAALKAWVGALEMGGRPLPLRDDQVIWAEITVAHSPAGAPQVRLIGEMARLFSEGLSPGTTHGQPSPNMATSKIFTAEKAPDLPSPPTKAALNWHASASHDGDYALAFVVLSRDA